MFLSIALIVLCICSNCNIILGYYIRSGYIRTSTKYSFNTLPHLSRVVFSTPITTGDCCDGKANNGDCTSETKPSTFIVNRYAELTDEEISDENLLKIVTLEATDNQANELVWKCLGYKFSTITESYSADDVFPKWKAKYPQPPDLIGVKRIYDPDVDKPFRNASMELMRSIPRDYKGGVRNLVYLGFQGFLLKELTPNKTRRAQVYYTRIYLL